MITFIGRFNKHNNAYAIATVSIVKNHPFSGLRRKLVGVNIMHFISMLTLYEFIQIGTFKLERTDARIVIGSLANLQALQLMIRVARITAVLICVAIRRALRGDG